MTIRINGMIDDALVERLRNRIFQECFQDPCMSTMTFGQVNALAFAFAVWLIEAGAADKL